MNAAVARTTTTIWKIVISAVSATPSGARCSNSMMIKILESAAKRVGHR
jgi:hypothetical protein